MLLNSYKKEVVHYGKRSHSCYSMHKDLF
jgi:hypothetical protein